MVNPTVRRPRLLSPLSPYPPPFPPLPLSPCPSVPLAVFLIPLFTSLSSSGNITSSVKGTSFISFSLTLILSFAPLPLPYSSSLQSTHRVLTKGIYIQRNAQHASPDGLLDRHRWDNKCSFFLRALRLLQTLRSPPTLQLVPIREGELLSIQGDTSFHFFLYNLL